MAPRTLIDHEYRKFVRAKPCVVAVAMGHSSDCEFAVEFCHYHHSGMGGKDVPDIGNAFPACLYHHRESHTIGIKSWQTKYLIQLVIVCIQLETEYRLGVCFPDEPWGVEVSHL